MAHLQTILNLVESIVTLFDARPSEIQSTSYAIGLQAKYRPFLTLKVDRTLANLEKPGHFLGSSSSRPDGQIS